MDPIIIFPPDPSCSYCHSGMSMSARVTHARQAEHHTLKLKLSTGSTGVKSGVFVSKPTGVKPITVTVKTSIKKAA